MEKYNELKKIYFISRKAPEVFYREETLGDEDVKMLYNYITTELVVIGETNKKVYDLLDGTNDLEKVVEIIASEYSIEEHSSVKRDVTKFVGFLCDKNFIKKAIREKVS